MIAVRSFREGWKLLLHHRQAWFIVYCCNLLFGVIAVIPVVRWIKHVAGQSVLLTESAGHFDFTFLTDLMRNYGAALPAILGVLMTLALGYVFLSVFLSGGVLMLFHDAERFDRQIFFKGAYRHFTRLLRIALIFLLLQLILLALLAITLIATGLDPFEMENDVRFLSHAKWVVLIYGCLVFLLMLWHTYAKITAVERRDASVLKATGLGFRFVRRQFLLAVTLYVLNALLFGAILLSAHLLKDVLPAASSPGIFLLLLLGQLSIAGRIGVRLLVLSSGVRLWRNVDGLISAKLQTAHKV